jgi:hypothetical protein
MLKQSVQSDDNVADLAFRVCVHCFEGNQEEVSTPCIDHCS